MSRYDDIDPQDLDPRTGAPYRNYSSPSLDTSFHDGEMAVDDEPEDGEVDTSHRPRNGWRYRDYPGQGEADDDDGEEISDDPRARQGMGH